jgi:hypothetical protein
MKPQDDEPAAVCRRCHTKASNRDGKLSNPIAEREKRNAKPAP